MKNPAEELVTAWLQECKGFFTMSNIKVPKTGGGMGAEIDILAIDKHKNIWVEVAVSTKPRQRYHKEERLQKNIDDYLKDFNRKDKNSKAKEIFHGKVYEKWFVHGRLPLSKEEIIRFPLAMKQKGVKTIDFEEVLNDLLKLKHYRLDSARGYLNLFKAFIMK